MRYVRRWIRNVFGFSGNEINGFLILIPLMLVLIFSGPLYQLLLTKGPRQYSDDARNLDSLVALWDKEEVDSVSKSDIQGVTPFTFDPNAVSVADLRRLGFSGILANRIAAYRRKGGVFRIKSDLMKIYDLDSALYNQLYAYISLPSARLVQTLPKKRDYASQPELRDKRGKIVSFDINTADTTTLEQVYGIGSTLADRIVKFRDGLGGFVSTEQLYEVYGLDSVVVKRLIKICFVKADFVPQKININTADEKKLSRHPYIRHGVARALVNYRFQHGDFKDVSDIKKSSALKPEEVDKILPYLSIED